MDLTPLFARKMAGARVNFTIRLHYIGPQFLALNRQPNVNKIREKE
jgi:hypothetical protein